MNRFRVSHSLPKFSAMLLLALLACVGVARAESTAGTPQTSETSAAIQQVIVAQIDAFKRDDAEAAFDIAAPSIQQQFVTPGNFINMVRIGYPAVFRAQKLFFLKIVEQRGEFRQSVLIAGPDGELVQGVYSLVQLNGDWRITGCVLVKRSGDET